MRSFLVLLLALCASHCLVVLAGAPSPTCAAVPKCVSQNAKCACTKCKSGFNLVNKACAKAKKKTPKPTPASSQPCDPSCEVCVNGECGTCPNGSVLGQCLEPCTDTNCKVCNQGSSTQDPSYCVGCASPMLPNFSGTCVAGSFCINVKSQNTSLPFLGKYWAQGFMQPFESPANYFFRAPKYDYVLTLGITDATSDNFVIVSAKDASGGTPKEDAKILASSRRLKIDGPWDPTIRVTKCKASGKKQQP